VSSQEKIKHKLACGSQGITLSRREGPRDRWDRRGGGGGGGGGGAKESPEKAFKNVRIPILTTVSKYTKT
jgi:hypothetical protein